MFGVLKGYGVTVAKEIDVPLGVYGVHGALMGASKLVVDMAVKDKVQRAVGCGLLFAGACYAMYQDDNYALNGALGVASSYVADLVVPVPSSSSDEEQEGEE